MSPPDAKSTLYEMQTATINRAGGLGWLTVGTWSEANKLNMSYYLYPEKHHGFNNRTFIVTTIPVRIPLFLTYISYLDFVDKEYSLFS